MATKAKTEKSQKTTVSTDGLVAVRIPLVNVAANFAWNPRFGNLTADSGDEKANNFSHLKASIRADGQDTPVDVRPKKGSADKFELVTGFRRYSALTAIAKEDGAEKTATILAFVRHDNDIAARARNLRENLARDDLRGPDLAYGVFDLQNQMKAAGLSGSGNSVSMELGRNQAYIARLLKIMNEVKPEITKQWRELPVKLTIEDMLGVASVSKEGDAQDRQFADLLSKKGPKPEAEKGPNRWVDTAIAKGEELAGLIGRLEKLGFITTEGLDFENPDHLEKLVKLNPKAESKHKVKIMKAMQHAYEAALKAKEPEEKPKAEKADKKADKS